MGKNLRALYRLANSSEINFIEGFEEPGISEGFVFADFSREKTFTLKPNIQKIISRGEVAGLDFSSSKKTNWESTTKDDYDFGFTIIQNEIEHKHIHKAILSRKKVIDKKVNAVQLFLDLEENYKESHVFLIETPDDELWIGATPETLLTEFNGDFETMSLAGTKKDLVTDWTSKEYEEQRIVTNTIVGELFKLGIDPVISDLETAKAGMVYHLRNKINFSSDKSVLEIAEALHPTPAISGSPKIQAVSTIKIAENHSREFYCGIGGPYSVEGKTHLFVNLRCASISENQICLFVGGGITKDSVLDKEWQECERKALSLLSYL